MADTETRVPGRGKFKRALRFLPALLFCAAAGAAEPAEELRAAAALRAGLGAGKVLTGPVAVAPFRSPDGRIGLLGVRLADELGRLLMEAGAVVLERRRLDGVLAELRLKASGAAGGQDSAALDGADFLVLGELGPPSGGRLPASCRLVEVATGRIVAEASAEMGAVETVMSHYISPYGQEGAGTGLFPDIGGRAGGPRVELLLSRSRFEAGQPARAAVTVSSAAEVYIYSVGPEGAAARVFPPPGGSPLVEAGRPLLFPSHRQELEGLTLNAEAPPPPGGPETLRAFALEPGGGDILHGALTYREIERRLESSGRAWSEDHRVFTVDR